MAFRMNLVFPSGTRLAGSLRWPHGPVHAVTLQSTRLGHLSTSIIMSNQYRSFQSVTRQLESRHMYQHRHASNTTSLVQSTKTNNCAATYTYIPQSNYTSVIQRAYPVLQVYRYYSNGVSENSKSTDSKSTIAASTSTTAAGQSSGDAVSTAPAQSSTQRIKIILREYGTVAVVFHISMSLCVLSVCYILVSK